MLSRRVLIVSLILVLSAAAASAQNTNSSTTSRPRATNSNENKSTVAPQSTAAPKTTVAPKATATPKTAVAPKTSTEIQGPVITPPTARHAAPKPKAAVTEAPGAADVVAAFNSLLEGIRHANVKAVAGAYQNSPRLLLFNNNGTVTRGWDQMRKNRESSYPDVKDVKLDVKDVQITMLGRDGAVVTCLWSQSQTYKDTPETASGRMTLVFKRVGKDWKAVHLHTSPDKEDPSRVLPSEQTPSPTPTPAPER